MSYCSEKNGKNQKPASAADFYVSPIFQKIEVSVCPHTLLSPPANQKVSSGQDAFTSLFGMGRGGAHLGKTRANRNSDFLKH